MSGVARQKATMSVPDVAMTTRGTTAVVALRHDRDGVDAERRRARSRRPRPPPTELSGSGHDARRAVPGRCRLLKIDMRHEADASLEARAHSSTVRPCHVDLEQAAASQGQLVEHS